MVAWSAFTELAPGIAVPAAERFAATGLSLVGTLRGDGWPRISPVEPLFHDGELCLGMMWESMKALDLRRDPRCLVHSTIADKDGTEGECKLYGRAAEVSDEAAREAYCVALEAATGWRPTDDKFHLFTVDIERAAYQVFGPGDAHRTVTWSGA